MELEVNIVNVARVSKVVKGGRRFSFRALVVVGDRAGHVGIGLGKAAEVPDAIEKGAKNAKQRLIKVPLASTTIPYKVEHKFCSSTVMLKPAAPGTGVIAGGSVRAVVEAAGIHDILTKSFGSTNPLNVMTATLGALGELRSRESVLAARGVLSGRDNATTSGRSGPRVDGIGSLENSADRLGHLARATEAIYTRLTRRSHRAITGNTLGSRDAGPMEMDAILRKFVDATDWSDVRRMLLEHEAVLLSVQAVSQLQRWIELEGQTGHSVERLERRSRLLEEARNRGSVAALDEQAKELRMSVPLEIQLLLARLDQLAEAHDYGERAALLNTALSALPRKANPTLWALLQAELGLSLAQQRSNAEQRPAEHAQGLQRALECFENAQQIVPPNVARVKWPALLYNELLVLRELADLSPPRDREELLRRAEERALQLSEEM